MVQQIDISTYDHNSPELLLQQWQKEFITILDTVAPIRTFPMRRHQAPYLNGEIRELIRHRDFLAKKLKKNPGSSTTKEDLKLAQKRVKSRIRREAKDQATQALNSSYPADAWNYIKRATSTTKGGEDFLPPLHTLNQYFASVVQATQNTQLIVPPGCNNDNSFRFSELTSREVQKARHYPRSNLLQNQDMTSFQVLCLNDSQERWRQTSRSFTTVLHAITLYPVAGKWQRSEPSTNRKEVKLIQTTIDQSPSFQF